MKAQSQHRSWFARGLALVLALILGLALHLPTPALAQAPTTPAGYVRGWGWNHAGELDIPADLNDAIAISTSQTYGLALRSNGTVVGWGLNYAGQVDIPAGLNNVIAVAAGGSSLALKSDGTVVAWGDNTYGQAAVPAGLSNVVAIAAGDFHSLALKRDGTVVAWGCGGGYDYGQCTIPAGLNGNVKAIAAGDIFSLALRNDGRAVIWGDQTNVPPGAQSNVVAIAAGGSSAHSLALKSDGTVVAWGDNQWGQIDVPPGLGDVVKIATGYGHSVALKRDGTVVAWGQNAYGQADVPPGLTGGVAIAASWTTLVIIPPTSVTINQAAGQADPASTTPIQFTASFSKPVSGFAASDVSLSGSANLAGATVTLSGGPSVYTISVDGVASSGTVIAAIPANAAIDGNGFATLASTSSDNSVTVSQNASPPTITPNVVGTLGNNGWYVSNVAVSWTVAANGAAISSQSGCDPQNVTSDTGGVTFTCTAANVNGSTSRSVTIKRDTAAPTISAAATTNPNAKGWYNSDVSVHFTCSDAMAGVANCPADQALSAEGTAVSSTAQTVSDQAGNTSAASNVVTVKLDKTAPVVAVTGVTNWANYATGGAPAAGCTTSDALSGVATQSTLTQRGGNASDTGLFFVTCGGATDNAGNSGSASASYTVAISAGNLVSWGWNGFGQTDIPANLGRVIAVAAGRAHSLALKPDGTVVAWGLNASGQATVPPGLSDVAGIAAGGERSLAVKRDGTVVAWGDNTYGQLNIPAGLSDVVAIAASPFHSLALKRDGTVVAWGFNTSGGPNAVPAGLSNVVAIAVGNNHNLALKRDGTLVAWGNNTFNQLNIPAAATNVVAIDAEGDYSMALRSDGTVVTWGINTTGPAGKPADLSDVIGIGAGRSHSAAFKSDGTVVAWGGNRDGEGSVPVGLHDAVALAVGVAHNLVIVDAPLVTVNQAAGQADPTTANPVRFAVVFSEPVTGFSASDVTLSGTADRAGATVAVSGGPAAYTVTVNGLAGNGTVIATIAAGVATAADGKSNIASTLTNTDNSVTVNLDSTPPVITPNVAGTLGSNGWYTSDVAVSWSVTDSESAISAQTGCAAQSVTSDTSGVTFTCTATSAGGTASRSVTINRDATAPTITFANRTAPNAAGWNNSAVTVAWTCSDATSGAASASVSKTLSSEGANQSATGTCADNAGNAASNTQSGIKIDTTAPTISAAATTSPNANGWYNGDVVVTFTCADGLSGVTSCPSDQVLSGEGAAVASTAQTVVDRAGNTSAASNVVSVKIDRTPPTISAAAATSPNASGWYNGDVSVAFSCADALSGIAGACPPNQVLSGEGASVSSTAKSVSDQAGNSATSNVVTAKIDRTAPVVSVTGVTNGATYPFGSVPAAGCSTSDALSGVATQATLTRSGGSLGLVTVTCAGATDKAGNAAPATSVSYRVAYSFVGFSQPVDNLPTVNNANAGRTIPLKWRVTDAAGNPITNLSNVIVTSVVGGCSASAPSDTLEEYATSNTGLMNQGNGYYQFNWQTDRAWSGCRTLRLDLGDGVSHTALFQFR